MGTHQVRIRESEVPILRAWAQSGYGGLTADDPPDDVEYIVGCLPEIASVRAAYRSAVEEGNDPLEALARLLLRLAQTLIAVDRQDTYHA